MANVIRIKRRLASSNSGTSLPALRNAELAFNEINNTLYIGRAGDDTGGSTTGVTATPIVGEGAVWTGTATFGNVKTTGYVAVGDEAYAYTNTFPPSADSAQGGKLLASTEYVDSALARGTGSGMSLFPVAADVATTVPIVAGSYYDNLQGLGSVRVAIPQPSSAAAGLALYELKGTPTVQGVNLVANDRVLIMGHLDPTNIGIWTIPNGAGSSTPWVREAGLNVAQAYTYGARVFVTAGDNVNKTFAVASDPLNPTKDVGGPNFNTLSFIQHSTGSTTVPAGANIKFKRVVRAKSDYYQIIAGKVVVDGIVLNQNDRFIWTPKNENPGGHNPVGYDGGAGSGLGAESGDHDSPRAGIYRVNYDRTLATNLATNLPDFYSVVVRAGDFNDDIEAVAAHNTKVLVREGATNANKIFNITTDASSFFIDDTMGNVALFTYDSNWTGAAGSLSGTPIIDGVQTVFENLALNPPRLGSVVLVKNEVDQTTNGLYYIKTSGAWERHPSANETGELAYGSYIRVKYGTINKNSGFVQVANFDPLVIGTNPIVFESPQALLDFRAGVGLGRDGRSFYVKTASTARINVTEVGVDLAVMPNFGSLSVETDPAQIGTAYLAVHADKYGRVLASSRDSLTADELRDKIVGVGATDDTTGTGNLVFAENPTLNGATIGSTYGLNFSTDNNITAGTDSQGSVSLSNDINIVLYATNSPSGVTLPAPTAGRRVIVMNASASNTVNVYPASSHQIDSRGADASLPLIPGTQAEFVARDTTQWYSVSGSAGGSGSSGMGYAATAVSGTTVTLSAASSYRQRFTGTGTQVVNLPSRTSLGLGRAFEIENDATGNVTVNTSSGTGNVVVTVLPGQCVRVTVNTVANAETSTASWTVDYVGGSTATGTTGQLVYATSPALAGTPTSTTAAVDTNTTQIATTAYVVGQAYAKLAGPALTGTPTAPTAAVDTSTTQIATTAFVLAQAGAATPAMDAGTAVVGTSTRFARADHVHPTDTSRAPLASPGLTGTPTAPTAAVDTNTTQIATTAYVVGQAYAKLAGPALTGTPTAPTAAVNTNTTQIATTAYVMGQGYLTSASLSSYAPLASPALTGTPTSTTAAVDTNTTQIATTAFVLAQAGAATPTMNAGTAVVGTSTRFARADHVHPTDTSRAPLASPALTGTPTAPTAAADTNTTQIATTAYVVGQAYAKLAGPALTGTPTSTTAAVDTNTTQIATTAFVLAQAGAATPTMNAGTAVVGTSTRFARADHVHPTDTSRAPLASPTFTGTTTTNDLTVSGNLLVSGTTTTVNTATLQVVDPIISIGGGVSGAALTADDSKDRGTAFQWHNGTVAKTGFFGWDRSTQRFAFVPDATISNEVVSGTLGTIDVGAVHINGSQISAANLSNGTTGTAGSSIVLATSPALAGTPTAPTAAADTNTTQIATTAYVVGQAYAKLAGPALTGTPTAPTAAVDTNTTQLATTAFVLAQAGAATPTMNAGTAVVGTSTRFARADHVHPTDTSRAPLASPGLTGTPTAPTAAADTNTTQIATTAYVVGQAYAKLAGPALTGTPTAPTAAVDTNTTQLATTAYVVGQGYLKSATAASTYFSLTGNNSATGASTFTSATGQTFRYAADNDQIVIRGRNGGSTNAKVVLTTATLTASTTRTLTIPDEDGTILTNTSVCGVVFPASGNGCTIDGGTF